MLPQKHTKEPEPITVLPKILPPPPKEKPPRPQRFVKGKKCPITGKTCLPERGAKRSAEKFRKTSINGKMYPYMCPFCNYWHLTHKAQMR